MIKLSMILFCAEQDIKDASCYLRNKQLNPPLSVRYCSVFVHDIM